MARTIDEIKKLIVAKKNENLKLVEINSDSKVSFFNAVAYIIASVIHSFEVILDIFREDIDTTITNRVNGNPAYYIRTLLEYQQGDTLEVSDDGMRFGYPQIDTAKRIITKAAYQEAFLSDVSLDKLLLLKVATGSSSNLMPLTPEQVVQVTAYMNQMKWAGVNLQVVSRIGDILIPRYTIYHDGALSESLLMNNIKNAIYDFIQNMPFDSKLYVTQFQNAILKVDHVTDIWVDPDAVPTQGLKIIDFDESGVMQAEREVKRETYTTAGYLRESSKVGQEELIPDFDDAIILKIENR